MKVTLVLLICFLIGCSTGEEKCSINYSQSSRSFQPFILDSEGAFLTPNYEDKINVAHGDSVTFSCMQFNIEDSDESSVEFTCVNGELKTDRKDVQYSDIRCQLRVIDLYSATGSDSCANNLVLYYFSKNSKVDISKSSIVGETCYDVVKKTPTFSHFKVSSIPKFVQNPPGISEGPFLSTVDILFTYRSDKLTTKVSDLLGSKDKVNDTLRSVSLIPKELVHPQFGDVSRRAHNLVGMWESIQQGNWENLINDIRSINRKSREFDIYTGVYETLSLPNINNQQEELYLKQDASKSNLAYPIPAFIWTVVYERSSHKGVAITLANNVVHEENIEDLALCKNTVCEDIEWIKNLKKNDNFNNFNLGYVSCCNLNSFRGIVSGIPAIDNLRVGEGSDGLLSN